jgi:hypothetical protein
VLAPLYFFFAEHRAAAPGGTTVAVLRVIVGVVQVVLIRQLFTGGNVANAANVNSSFRILFRLTVWVAAVIEEHGGPEPVDDLLLTAREQVCNAPAFVADVGFPFRESRAIVLADSHAFLDTTCRVTAGSMDRGRANDESGEHSAPIITGPDVDAITGAQGGPKRLNWQ